MEAGPGVGSSEAAAAGPVLMRTATAGGRNRRAAMRRDAAAWLMSAAAGWRNRRASLRPHPGALEVGGGRRPKAVWVSAVQPGCRRRAVVVARGRQRRGCRRRPEVAGGADHGGDSGGPRGERVTGSNVQGRTAGEEKTGNAFFGGKSVRETGFERVPRAVQEPLWTRGGGVRWGCPRVEADDP